MSGGGVSKRMNRGQRILENLSSHGVVNEDSKNFLLAALDPYHDVEFPVPVGFPDGCTERSVVRCINQSLTVSGALLGDDWTLVVNNNPFLDNCSVCTTVGEVSPYMRENNTIIEYDGANSAYANVAYTERFINVDSYASTDTDWSDLGKNSANSSSGFTIPDAYLNGVGRLIGAGIEIHNVTPDLYKGGTITVGEIPQATTSSFVLNQHYLVNLSAGTGTYYTTTSSNVRPLAPRPTNLAQAMTYPGSRQWEAKDGMYMVLSMEGVDNPPKSPEYTYPMYLNQLVSEGVSTANNEAVAVVPSQPHPGISVVRESPGPMKWTPLSSKFAILTGLSAETKITVNCRLFYESFPTMAEEDILTLATPSPDLDPHALALYQHCMTHLPVAVPVGMNGLGEWFAMAVSEFADVAGLGLSALGVPFANQLAGGAKVLANQYLKTSAKKSNAKGKTTVATVRESSRRKKKMKNKSGGVTTPLIPPSAKRP